MTEPPPVEATTPGTWEKWWPRFMAVLQAGLGTAVIVYELLSGGDRLNLILFAGAAVLGSPWTYLAARILARSPK